MPSNMVRINRVTGSEISDITSDLITGRQGWVKAGEVGWKPQADKLKALLRRDKVPFRVVKKFTRDFGGRQWWEIWTLPRFRNNVEVLLIATTPR